MWKKYGNESDLRRSKAPARRRTFETLEQRMLLACNPISLPSPGTLTIFQTPTLQHSTVITEESSECGQVVNVSTVSTNSGGGIEQSSDIDYLAATVNKIVYHGGNQADDVTNLSGVKLEAFGNGGADQLVGGSAGDLLDGGGGADLLTGNAGDDNISGGTGNDTLIGGPGNDVLNGGPGIDSVDPGSGDDQVTDDPDPDDGPCNPISLPSPGHLEIFQTPNLDHEVSISEATTGCGPVLRVEIISTEDGFLSQSSDLQYHLGTVNRVIYHGGNGFDFVTNDSSKPLFADGGEGDDVIIGGSGGDSLSGGPGNDNLLGRGGTDTLRGGEGDDTLIGGEGEDSLDGEEGEDLEIEDGSDDQASEDVAEGLDLPAGTEVTVVAGPLSVGVTTHLEERFFFSESLLSFPTGNDPDFLILSNGIAAQVTSLPNDSDSQGTDLPPIDAAGDTTKISFSVDVPANADFVSFDFVFLSEEFPEFVGTEFNDFFSAKVNGVEIAKDEFGNIVDINNVHFDGDLATDGTFFDGRTQLLRAFHTIPEGTGQLQVELSVGDVGDGIYDSAVLLDNFQIGRKQTILLDYSDSTVNYANHLFDSPGFQASDVGLENTLTPELHTMVTSKVKQLFAGVNLEITDQPPDEGAFSRVYFGGVPDIPLITEPHYLGIAEQIDIGNSDPEDDALVFTQNFTAQFGAMSLDTASDIIAITAAHEISHLLGAQHVESELDCLMNSAVGVENLDSRICDVDLPLAHGSGTQNTLEYFRSAVGAPGGSAIIPGGQALRDEILSFFALALQPLGTTDSVYDVTIGVFTPGNEDVSPHMIQLPQANSDSPIQVQIPVFSPDDRIFFIGSTEPGGKPDVFSGVGDVGTDFTVDDIAQPFLGGDGQVQETLPIVLTDANGVVQSQSAVVVSKSDTPLFPSIAVELAPGSGDEILFDEVEPGATLAQEFTLTNSGQGMLDVFGLTAAEPFEVRLANGDSADGKFSIVPSTSVEVVVTFAPTEPGEFSETIVVASNDLQAGNITINLVGTAAVKSLHTHVSKDDTGRIVIEDTVGTDNQVAISFDPITSELVIRDDSARLTSEIGTQSDDHEVRLSIDSHEGAQLVVFLGSGNDVLSLDWTTAEPGLLTMQASGGGGEDQVEAQAARASILSDAHLVLVGGAGPLARVALDGFDSAVLNGGAGRQRMNAASFSGPVTLSGGEGPDILRGGFGADHIIGGPGRDVLSGGPGHDLLIGGHGADILRGGGGDDVLLGGHGSDNLQGSQGNDVLVGGVGRDRVTPGSGTNIGIGGAGGDLFISRVGVDLILGSSSVHDNSEAALRSILDEWASEKSLVDKISNLTDPETGSQERLNGEMYLNSETTEGDGVRDIVLGSGRTKLLEIELKDVIRIRR